jgi:replicative DNA helicase
MQLEDPYPFNREFRLKILSLMLDSSWMTQYGIDIVRPQFFEQDDEETICKALLKFWADYKSVPSDPEDVIVIAGDENAQLIHELFDSDSDTRLASDKAVEWAKEQAVKVAILESADDVKAKRLKDIIPRLRTALAIGDNLLSPGIDVIADTEMWLYDIFTEKVRTGFTHVDHILSGGLGPGELGVILAPVNRGKSMALVNIGYGAATIGSAKNVVHFSHEMNATVVSKRYAARLTFRFPTKGDDLAEYETSLIDAAMKLMPGKIRVIHQPKMTVDDMDNRLERLAAEGFEIGMIIDDYPDLLVPTRNYTDRRFELSGIYTDLRALGDKWKVPVWGASQSTRGSLSKEIITMQDIAEDIGKAAIADVIVAICQTRDERLTEQCRLFMAKVRDGENLGMFSAKYYGRSQAIISTGIVEQKVDEDA